MYRPEDDGIYHGGRHRTPACFRRTKEANEVHKQLKGENFVPEVQEDTRNDNSSQDNYHEEPDNNMSNQVFGSRPVYNYPSDKPEPLDGRDRYNRGPMSYEPSRQPQYESPRQQQYEPQRQQQPQYETPRQQQHYESPRQPAQESPRHQPVYGQQSYRAGRPDIGFQSEEPTSVPYPQEPIRRRRAYEQPPDIGYDPYAPNEAPKTHPGWILLLRYNKAGEAEVRRALTMCAKHIEADGGRILGIAPPRSVFIREGGDSWFTFGKMRYYGQGNWDIQQSPEDQKTDYSILAIYYPSLSRAIQWFDRDSSFKNKDFPARHTVDCIALPLNSSVDTQYGKTLVMTEYPKISHPEYFRDKFSIPSEDMMRKRFRATPYVVKTTSIPTDDPRMRVARHLRGSWIKRNSIITVSMFDSKQETDRYFTDSEFFRCKEAQDRVSAPTTVIIDLGDWHL
ncbi:hypothetical protein ACF0H5_007072 [Mactra antiquata]